MVKVKALRRHWYGHGFVEKGQEYEVSPDEHKVLKELGWSDVVQTREMKAEVGSIAKPEEPTGKRTYTRRDLTAEK